ncbi:MAG: amidohydrolase family protein [Candidatus Limnocylindrales bacterium]
MIIDSHTHAWRVWPYATASVPDPSTRGSIDHILFDLDRHGIDRAVVLAACVDHNPDNDAYVLEGAARHPDRLVAFPDVDSVWSDTYHRPGAAARLRARCESVSTAGIGHFLDEANDGWLTSEDADAWFREVRAQRLVMSIAAGPAWFEDIGRVAAHHPDVPLLLHHVGMIRHVDATAEGDVQALVALAIHPNIGVKASGFYAGSDETAEYPYPAQMTLFRRVYEAFGPRRVTWGSDHPVAAWEGCSLPQARDVVRRHAPFIRSDDLSLVMGGTIATLLEERRFPAAQG